MIRLYSILGIALAVGFTSAVTAKDRDFRYFRYGSPHARFADADDWEDYLEDREEFLEDLQEEREEYFEDLRERREEAREGLEEFYEDREKLGRRRSSAHYFGQPRFQSDLYFPRLGFQFRFYHGGYRSLAIPRDYDYYHPHPQYGW